MERTDAWRIVLGLCALGMGAGGARAEGAGELTRLQLGGGAEALTLAAVPAAAVVPFAKGTVAVEVEASYTDPIRFSTDEFLTGTVGVGYYFADGWSASVLGHGLSIRQSVGEDTSGAGVSVLLRWHFVREENWSLYLDGGGGLAWTEDAVPLGGTTYNFTGRAGGGLSFRLADQVHLIGGARYSHLSNANQHGREKNPSFDGVEYYVGVLFTVR